ncbi:hypothetical protein J4E91_002020 [Alternaria rosae]|nr:hypothetical protein J4E91_002020 [Alternaria rosae]
MAFNLPGVLVLLSLVTQSSSQQDDPVKGFCRRWGHSTAQVDSRLYIDGGMIGQVPFRSNYSNDWLLFSDLNTSTVDAGMPMQSAYSKPGHIPTVSGGYTWADETNKCFYQFGGEFAPGTSPMDFSMWTYDVLLNQWNTTETIGDKDPQRVSYGAGTQVESRGLGFYFGGWLSNKTTPGWNGPPMATTGLIRFDMSTGDLQNTTGPDETGRAEGQLVFLPVSDSGVLVYFGGIEDSYRNGSFDATIHIYDMASSKWYTQTASGDVPDTRRQFCADVTWPDDQSSFNIYLYGGYGFEKAAAYDDVYILSLPSFTWIKVFSSDDVPSQVGHGGCSANVVNHAQMLVIGGWFPLYDKCDAPEGQGQHNMVLGYNGGDSKLWDKFSPQLHEYVVPSPIIAAVGGGPTGGATKTSPATWGHPDLATYYTLKPTFTARSATRSLPLATESASAGSSKKSNVAAIAGGTVGGLVALIAILCLILFCLHRRKKSLKKKEGETPSSLPPAELATTVPQEMADTDASKYVSMHNQADSIALAHYPGHVQQHSHSASHDYNSPYSAQGPPSYGHAPSYTSPIEGGHSSRSPHGQQFFTDDARNSPPVPE